MKVNGPQNMSLDRNTYQDEIQYLKHLLKYEFDFQMKDREITTILLF